MCSPPSATRVSPSSATPPVLDICTHFLDLQDPRMNQFGMFVEDVDEPGHAAILAASTDDLPPYAGLPKTPHPLQSDAFMGEVLTLKVRQNQPFK